MFCTINQYASLCGDCREESTAKLKAERLWESKLPTDIWGLLVFTLHSCGGQKPSTALHYVRFPSQSEDNMTEGRRSLPHTHSASPILLHPRVHKIISDWHTLSWWDKYLSLYFIDWLRFNKLLTLFSSHLPFSSFILLGAIKSFYIYHIFSSYLR